MAGNGFVQSVKIQTRPGPGTSEVQPRLVIAPTPMATTRIIPGMRMNFAGRARTHLRRKSLCDHASTIGENECAVSSATTSVKNANSACGGRKSSANPTGRPLRIQNPSHHGPRIQVTGRANDPPSCRDTSPFANSGIPRS